MIVLPHSDKRISNRFRIWSVLFGTLLSVLTILPKLHAVPYTLQKIKLASLSQAEQISLQFDGAYPDEPIVNFEPGALSVRLVGTRMAEGLGAELTPPDESLIRNVLVSNQRWLNLSKWIFCSTVREWLWEILRSGVREPDVPGFAVSKSR